MGLSKGEQLRKGNLVERLLGALRRADRADTMGGRDCDVGFACSLAENLLSAAESNTQLQHCITVSSRHVQAKNPPSLRRPTWRKCLFAEFSAFEEKFTLQVSSTYVIELASKFQLSNPGIA